MKLITLLNLNHVRWGQKFYRGLLGKTIGSLFAHILAKRQLRLLKTSKSLQLVQLKGVNSYNQSTHPDVLFSKEVFPGKFVMTISGYPYEDEKEENPYLLISDDGVNFRNILGDRPVKSLSVHGSNHYSDGDIIEVDGRLWLYYRFCDNGDNKKDILFLKTIDKTGDVSGEIIVLSRKKDKLISPAVVNIDSYFSMFFVEYDGDNYILKKLDSSNPLFNKYEETTSIIHNMPLNNSIWHIDVIKINTLLLGLFVLSSGPFGKGARLYVSTSSDNGFNWYIKNEIKLDANYKYIERVYRSSAVIQNDICYLYIPIMTKSDCWYTFFSKVNLKELSNELLVNN